MKRFLLTAFCLTLPFHLQAQTPASGAPQVSFESELPLGEGSTSFTPKVESLKLHAQPDANSPATDRKVTLQKSISYKETRLKILKPGVVKALRDAALENAASLGKIAYLSRQKYYEANSKTQTLNLKSGETLEYLQKRAEGSCLVRRQGEVFELSTCDFEDKTRFSWETQPTIEQWIQLPKTGAETGGWLRVDDRTLSF